MLVALAALLIHPQLSPAISLSAKLAALDAPAAVSTSNTATPADIPLPPAALSADASAQPAVIGSPASLPDAPAPEPAAAMNVPAPVAFLKPAKPMTVSVAVLAAENRRNQMIWRGLFIASSGAATFDAWSTRHAITTAGGQELNPLLKPFAGNASLYAAIQVGPLLMDYAGRKMMYSRHPWVRRMWWVPQSASFVSSLFCGAHNLSYH